MNNYTDLVEIGKGSFGTVYKALKRNYKEPFAIKKVRCNAPENVELALQEFWTLSYLQKHLNIIRFEECYLQHAGKMRSMKHGDVSSPSYLYLVEMSIKGESAMTRGRYHLWFVMEYCDGGDMNDYLLSRVPIAKLNASFMSQLADGIAFLHRNSVVHRDLKPENILVRTSSCESGGGSPFPTLKIADFGLSKVCSSKTQSQVNVDTCWLSSACGSDFFMAPEVFEGHYTAKADVFALGIMFWAIMDRITFIDATTKKVLLGTYIRRDKDVLPVGEALLDDSKLNLNELLSNTGIRKNVIFARGMERSKVVQSSTCVSANKSKLRNLISGMLNPNADVRPTSQELLAKLKAVLNLETKSKKKQVTKLSPKKSSLKTCSKLKTNPVLPCVDARSPVTIEQCRRPKRGHLHRIVCANDAAEDEANNASSANSAAPIYSPTKRVTRSSSSLISERSPTPPTTSRVLRSRKGSTTSMQAEMHSAVKHSKSPRKNKLRGANAKSSVTDSSPKSTKTVKSKELLRVRKKSPSEGEKPARAAKCDRILRSSFTTRRKTLRAWKQRDVWTTVEKTNPPRGKKNATTTVNKNPKESTIAESNDDLKPEDISDESVSDEVASPNPHQVAVKKRWKHLSENTAKNEVNAEVQGRVSPNMATNKRRRNTVISISTTTIKPKPVYSPPERNTRKDILRTLVKEVAEEADENVSVVHQPIPTRVRPSLKQQIKESVKLPLATFPKPKAAPESNRRLTVQPPKLRLKGDKRSKDPESPPPKAYTEPIGASTNEAASDDTFASPPAQNSFATADKPAHLLKRKLSEPREESTPKRPRHDIPAKMFYSGSWQPAPWSHQPISSRLPIYQSVSPSQTIPTYSQAFRWSLNSLSVGNSPRMSSRPSVSSSLPPSPHTAGSSGRYLASFLDGVNHPLIPQIYKSTTDPIFQRRSHDSSTLLHTNPMLSSDFFVRAYARKSISHDLSPASPSSFLLQGPPTVPPVD
uniref:Probable serine/threonine-protein kinase DDB_G0278901 n=1 Tax=Phallusia mammillata TaxID=59560 RepID=A0A6F9DMV1_9ASCI|nr:probable serine/threonine-protein kinase DDB_G0278901 [Phallusia mammillata]